ncbi:transposase [Burkholderia sp. D-99]|nr:transposase [Burkholderia sp. D-99]
MIESWRIEYNSERSHSSLDYLTPEWFARAHGVTRHLSRTLAAFQKLNVPQSPTRLVRMEQNQRPTLSSMNLRSLWDCLSVCSMHQAAYRDHSARTPP